jgi:hypothetical protein
VVGESSIIQNSNPAAVALHNPQAARPITDRLKGENTARGRHPHKQAIDDAEVVIVKVVIVWMTGCCRFKMPMRSPSLMREALSRRRPVSLLKCQRRIFERHGLASAAIKSRAPGTPQHAVTIAVSSNGSLPEIVTKPYSPPCWSSDFMAM